MSELNKEFYEKLINEDIEWLEENTNDCLERKHIIIVLKDSIERIYNNE